MFNLLFAIVSITSIVLLKLDFYFRDFIFNDNRSLTVMMVGFGVFLSIKINNFIWGVFSTSNGPVGKLIHSTILITAVMLFIVLPFDNMHEFKLMFIGSASMMVITFYFIFKKLFEINTVNYSFVDLINNKFRMVFESSLFTAFMVSLFLLIIDNKDGQYNTFVVSSFIYFAIAISLSVVSKFIFSRNIIINSLAFYIFAFYIVFGAYEETKYTEMFLIAGCILLFLTTVYDSCMMVKYLYNPVKFLKSCQIPEWAKSMLSVRSDSGIDYFTYFKYVKIGKTFIQYNSILNRIDAIMNGEYSIIKNLTAQSKSEDRLFHIDDKAIYVRFFYDFFDVSKKFLDEQNDLDRYAFINISKIKAYLKASNMNYNDLTENDILVLEMFSY